MSSQNFDIRQVGTAVRDVTSSITDVVRSEVRLAQAELKDTASKLAERSLRVGIFAGIAAAGVFPFMAFLVIGLGELLGGNYWLSALIISLVFFIIGGAMAYRAYLKIKEADYDLPETRSTLGAEADVLQHKVQEISKRRSA